MKTVSNLTYSGQPSQLYSLIPLSRVENWRATEIISVRFQLPPRQTQRSDFPNWAFLLSSPKGLFDLSAWQRFQAW